MAIYHLTTKVFSRGKGQSAIAAAAYRAGERLFDELAGEQKSYRAGSDRILFNGMFTPSKAPDWSRDRNQFWNRAEQAEARKDGRLAREIEVSLPHELTDVQRQWLVADFVREAFVRRGYAADVAIHAPYRDSDQRNYHAHILISERQLDSDGFAARKDPSINSKEQLRAWREQWSKLANRHLERHGHEARIDHRSLEAQGIELEPTVHLGYAAIELVKRGAQSDRAEDFAGILTRNGIRLELKNAERDLARLDLIEEPVSSLKPESTRRRPSRETRAMTEEPTEELFLKQAAREAALLQELRESEERAQHYRLQRQAEAEEARKKQAEQEAAEERRSREGDISLASARYAIALGQTYDVRDPYASLARAAMTESAMFHRNQEKLREEIAKEADPDKRRIIELRRKIEGAEYMALTSDRLAGIGKAILGERESAQTEFDRTRAGQYRDMAAELRNERSSLIEATIAKAKEAQTAGPKAPINEKPQEARPQQQAAQQRGSAGSERSATAQAEPAPPNTARQERAKPLRKAEVQAGPQPIREASQAERQVEQPQDGTPTSRKRQRYERTETPREQAARQTAARAPEPPPRPPEPSLQGEVPLSPAQLAMTPERPSPQPERPPSQHPPEPAPSREGGKLSERPRASERVEVAYTRGQSMPLPNPNQTRVTRPAEARPGRAAAPDATAAPAPWTQPQRAGQGLQVKDSESGRLSPLQDYARALPPPPSPYQPPQSMRALLADPEALRKHQSAMFHQKRDAENAEKALERVGKDMKSGKPIESRDLKSLNREQWESVRKKGDEGLRQVVKEAAQRAQGRDVGRERER